MEHYNELMKSEDFRAYAWNKMLESAGTHQMPTKLDTIGRTVQLHNKPQRPLTLEPVVWGNIPKYRFKS
jgi:hypothetical protein